MFFNKLRDSFFILVLVFNTILISFFRVLGFLFAGVILGVVKGMNDFSNTLKYFEYKALKNKASREKK